MSNTNDRNAQAQSLPPRGPGDQQVFSAATSAVAGSADIWVGYALDAGGLRTPAGKCWVELEAVTTPAFVRFMPTATTGTTSSIGAVIPVGVPTRFYVDPTKDLFLDHISTGAGVLKWRRTGVICERSRI